MPEAPDTTTTPDGTDPATAAPAATDPPATGPEPKVVPPAPTADEPPADPEPVDKDKLIASVRRENAKSREKLRALEAQMSAIAKALNPDAGDGKPDSDTVIAESAALKRENLVLRYAAKNGGDPDALIDSRSFVASIADIDPAATDAADLIGEAIKAAVEKDSRLGAPAPTPTPPAKAGGGHHGGGHQAQPPKSLEEAIAARIGG